nr:MAG TPA: hypothetical protein [Bacteriophage sp.]
MTLSHERMSDYNINYYPFLGVCNGYTNNVKSRCIHERG